jgi:hypothetical protein
MVNVPTPDSLQLFCQRCTASEAATARGLASDGGSIVFYSTVGRRWRRTSSTSRVPARARFRGVHEMSSNDRSLEPSYYKRKLGETESSRGRTSKILSRVFLKLLVYIQVASLRWWSIMRLPTKTESGSSGNSGRPSQTGPRRPAIPMTLVIGDRRLQIPTRPTDTLSYCCP